MATAEILVKSETGALRAERGGALAGRVRVPGDKSISHRALILSALATGESHITGLLEGEDVLRTAAALKALGARIARDAHGPWRVAGNGVCGFAEPDRVLDLGNSGTGARLLMGAVAHNPILAFFSGDESLSRRPMGRVLKPLTEMGARAVARGGDKLPVALQGASLMPITYRLDVPSAQVKSAILLAGLGAPGMTTIIEPLRTRDHTERLLRHFGAAIEIDAINAHAAAISLTGCPEIAGTHITVPGDPSSAAFLTVATLIVPGSDVTIEGVCLNPLRTGLYTTLREMGAAITFANMHESGGEEIGDIRVKSSALTGIDVPPERAPSMIDEYPVLAVAAAAARGRTVMRGLSELRVKESDRLAAIARGLARAGVKVESLEDGVIVHGKGDGSAVPGGARIETAMDHRIAMAFLVMGLASAAPVAIDDARMIATSFPGFADTMRSLGARLIAAS
jgi:3-phosphoshikimate 1-carboxyvinyltransferase